MSRLTDNDKNFGPFTLGRWGGCISAIFYSHDEDYDRTPCNNLRFNLFGWALRIRLPRLIKAPCMEYGFTLSKQSEEGYDYLNVYYGLQSHDSSTEKRWGWFLPWKQWDMVRHSLYKPDGSRYYTDPHRKFGYDLFVKARENCPKVKFDFRDYDGKLITATCHIEEREWHRGEGWFKWLKYFWPAKIRRSLDLRFSSEVGPEKGSWKGGTIGTGCDMLPGETPEQAFRRYCDMEHRARHDRKFRITFLRAI